MTGGLSEQRSSLFCFGAKANDNIGIFLKLSNVTDKGKHRNLNQASVHNLIEGWSVGFMNYESISGKKCLQSRAKKMIINKSIDLLKNTEPENIKLFRKPAEEIKQTKLLSGMKKYNLIRKNHS